jgi:hypothetical protein
MVPPEQVPSEIDAGGEDLEPSIVAHTLYQGLSDFVSEWLMVRAGAF